MNHGGHLSLNDKIIIMNITTVASCIMLNGINEQGFIDFASKLLA